MTDNHSPKGRRFIWAWIDGGWRTVEHIATSQEYHGTRPAMALRTRVRTESGRNLEIPKRDMKEKGK